MFTGITERTGKVKKLATRGSVRGVTLEKPSSWKLTKGQSVMVDGICSTVVSGGKGTFLVEYMPETLRKTTAKTWKPGTQVNLERSLTLQTLLDGHLVQGHVDGTAKVTKVTKEGNSKLVTIDIPKSLVRFVAPRGSLAVNGVSLTVAKRVGTKVTLALIPLTLSHTNLGTLATGDLVNIETDLLARYLLSARKA